MKRLIFLTLTLCILLLLLPVAAQAGPGVKPTFDQAIDRLFAQGYPQKVDARIASWGTNPVLGMRFAGTPADDRGARYLAAQLRAAGLQNVHLDPVPVDEFDFKWADVTVGKRMMIASTFAGVMPTGPEGRTAQVVYAHRGTKQDFDDLDAAGVDVAGKLVMIDADFTSWWANDQAAEATYRGAIGVIFTYGPGTGTYYNHSDDTLGTFDSQFDTTDAPAVYIAKKDGDWLKSQLNPKDVGPVATMTLIEKVRLTSDGGTGYNVVGDIPGTVKDGTFTLFDAHHDGYFHGATDDLVGCVTNLAVAKAMMMSGYQPKHTLRFMFVTGEEFGYANAYNDWCIGAWWAATNGHPEWIGQIRGFINNDQTSGAGRFNMTANPEFRPYLTAQGNANGSLFGARGWRVATTPNSSWNDSYTFTAAGAPSVTVSSGGKPSVGVYHTQYMTIDLNDFDGLRQDAKFIGRLAEGLDGGLLPYSFSARAAELAGKVNAAALTTALNKAGVSDVSSVTRLQNDIAAFQAAAAAYDGRAASITDDASVNSAILQIHKELGLTFSGLDVWQMAIYPHEQVLADVQRLEAAIAALGAVDEAGALDALSNVAWSSVGLRLSQPVYLHLITRLAPDYYRATWGAQGHSLELASLLNIVPQYEAIQAGTWGPATVIQLNAMLQHDAGDLIDRLNAMSDTLEQVTPEINALN